MNQLKKDLENEYINLFDLRLFGEKEYAERFYASLRDRVSKINKTIKTPDNQIRDISHFKLFDALDLAYDMYRYEYIKIMEDIKLSKIHRLLKEKGKDYGKNKNKKTKKQNANW